MPRQDELNGRAAVLKKVEPPMVDSSARSLLRKPATWLVTSAAFVALDFASGPFVQVPVFFALPPAIAGWHGKVGWGIVLGIVAPLARLGFYSLWKPSYSPLVATLNALASGLVGAALAVLAARAARTRAAEQELRALEGILPICSFCRQMREPDGSWVRLEEYFSRRAPAEFSHGVCPACAEEHYGPYLRRRSRPPS